MGSRPAREQAYLEAQRLLDHPSTVTSLSGFLLEEVGRLCRGRGMTVVEGETGTLARHLGKAYNHVRSHPVLGYRTVAAVLAI
ncbi:MAG: hypothetical protein ACR2JC_08100 [Chloroflexota bacterium]|nr:MAG: hypothetical protein DLM70_12680 [Chloroflexota bacterium]